MKILVQSLLKITITVSLLGSAHIALADPIPSPRVKPSAFTQAAQNKIKLSAQSKIGFARIQDGRVIGAPLYELRDWAHLSARLSSASDNGANRFAPITPTQIFNVTAAYEAGGRPSENRLDEIRLAAADHDMDYVIIYGAGRDAGWNSFGGMALRDTGFVIPAGHRLSPKGEFKALIVKTHSGQVVGTVTSNNARPGHDGALGELTHRLERALSDLSGGAISGKTLT
jgi:hypothetical protein